MAGAKWPGFPSGGKAESLSLFSSVSIAEVGGIFSLPCELASHPARLRQAVVNSDGVQFQFLATLCRINEDELLLG